MIPGAHFVKIEDGCAWPADDLAVRPAVDLLYVVAALTIWASAKTIRHGSLHNLEDTALAEGVSSEKSIKSTLRNFPNPEMSLSFLCYR